MSSVNNLKTVISFFFILLLIILSTGCQAKNASNSESTSINSIKLMTPDSPLAVTPEPFIFNTPVPESITVSGTLVVANPLTAIPDPNDAIYLVPLSTASDNISGIPPIDDQAIQAQVDEVTGKFIITNIQPGQYAVVVREKSGTEIVASFFDKDSMAILTLEDSDRDKVIELGFLRFP